ncbi:MAG: type IV pilus twitching motility protein PilT [Patescibacteria group bacterium]|nr:type IV pilus twitching motility protein PilT [Patescibacteria group bacterium]
MNIKDLFQIAIDKKASDLHLNVGLLPVLRIDGNLVPLNKFSQLIKKEMQEMVFSLLTERQKQMFEENRDLDFSYAVNDTRFRVNIHFEKENVGLAARIINKESPTMESVGMPEIVREMVDKNRGLILVTGPTGCGKSTTLAAIISYINDNFSRKIITLEDPIEFLFKPNKSLIIQRQLGSDIPSFESGLKHALRQDPNVIMVGEMRDLETIAATITLAETGHLVLATLHTYNAAQSIDRIIDVFPPDQQGQVRTQLSMTLEMVISQRLLPRVGGGRIATREIMVRNAAVGNLIRENKIAQIQSVIESGQESGMISAERDLRNLMKAGLISEEIAHTQLKSLGAL